MDKPASNMKLLRAVIAFGTMIVAAIVAMTLGHVPIPGKPDVLNPAGDPNTTPGQSAAIGSLEENHVVSVRQAAMQLFDDGADARYFGRYKDAVNDYQEGLKIWPDSPTGHIGLAWALFESGKFPSEIGEIRAAFNLAPESSVTTGEFGNIRCASGNVMGGDKEEWVKSIALRRQVVRHPITDPRNPWVQEVVVRRRTVGDTPTDPGSHTRLADALSVVGDLDGAAKEYRLAITLQDSYADAHYGLANVLKDQGKLDDAIREFRQALTLIPTQPPYVFDFAAALALKGNAAEAVEQLDIVLHQPTKVQYDSWEFKAYRSRLPSYVSVDPDFDSIRNDEAFQAALRR